MIWLRLVCGTHHRPPPSSVERPMAWMAATRGLNGASCRHTAGCSRAGRRRSGLLPCACSLLGLVLQQRVQPARGGGRRTGAEGRRHVSSSASRITSTAALTSRRRTAYRAEGVASWYGRDFHGRLTANGEVYDMHGISAAHTTLPLPSYVRVTNLETAAPSWSVSTIAGLTPTAG